MKRILFFMVIILAGLTAFTKKDRYHKAFIENFNRSSLKNFAYNSGGNKADFTREFGTPSPTEPGTKILSFKIDPEDPPGAGRGRRIPEKALEEDDLEGSRTGRFDDGGFRTPDSGTAALSG